MKFDDLNNNLNEGPFTGPAGFTKRAKAKLQKNIPFARQQQRRGAAKDKIYAKAKEIKDDLKSFMAKTGEEEIGMKDFLDWVQTNHEGEYDGILAAAKKIHSNLFPKDSKADQENQGAGDEPKQQQKAKDPNVSDEEIAQAHAKIAADAEAEAEELGAEDERQDLKASKGDDEEPPKDTSASIYESRFAAILAEAEAEVDQSLAASADGQISNDKLEDNQIDTLIVRGIQAQRKLAGTGKTKQIAAEPEQQAAPKEEPKAKQEPEAKAQPKAQAAAAAPDVEEPSSGGIALDKSDAKNAKLILTKAAKGEELSDKEKKVAGKVAQYLNKFV